MFPGIQVISPEITIQPYKLEFGEVIHAHDLSRRSFSEDGSAWNSEPDRAA